MKFYLLDTIEQLTDDRIVAIKHVSLAEEYLADHFPTFPVLPGVLMLEAATQAAAWLLILKHQFARSIVVLKEARNVKYGNFVAPGNQLRLEVEWVKVTDAGGQFKVATSVNGTPALSARLELAAFSLADQQPELASIDQKLRDHNRKRWDLIAPRSPQLQLS